MTFQDTGEDAYGVSGTIDVPVWYHNFVSALLGTLGVFGIFLNGFVICCFILHPIVSPHIACTQESLPCKIDYKDKVKVIHAVIHAGHTSANILIKKISDSHSIQLFAH